MSKYPPDVAEKLAEYRRLNTRRCSILKLGGFRPTENPATSNFGKYTLAASGESWPTYRGRPMQFICQFVVGDAPYIPDVLRDVAVVSFFIDRDEKGYWDIDYGVNGGEPGGWLVRSYRTLAGLTPLTPPAGYSSVVEPHEGRWIEAEDQPVYDDEELIEVDGLDLDNLDEEDQHLDNLSGHKLGGYPSTIQSGVTWPGSPDAKFAFQIDSDEKAGIGWVDSGVIYIGRSPDTDERPSFHFEWQFY